MTSAHFDLIAHTVEALSVKDKMRAYIAREFADALKKTNARFDREYFLRACEQKEEKGK